MKLALVQTARRQPDTDAVVYQHLHAVGPAILIVMDFLPKGSEMITISSVVRLGAACTETKAGRIAGD